MTRPVRSRDVAAPSAASPATRSCPPPPYAPYPLLTDAAALGLETLRVPTRLGPLVVRAGRERGGGAATVLLHGAAGSWSTWTPLLQAADARHTTLADLVLVDLPGWGDVPLPDRPLRNGRDSRTVEAYAGAVADAVRALGYHEWHLVGHSLGGFLALHLASVEPVRTRSVGLVSPTTFSVQACAAHPLRRFGSLPGYAALLGVMRAFAPLGGSAAVLLEGLRRLRALPLLTSPLFAQPGRMHDSVIGALAAEVRPEAFVVASRQAASYDSAAHWGTISCPVHSVRGDRDVFVTADDDRMLTATIANAATSVLPGTGHFGQIEAPFAVLDALADSFSPRS